LVITPSKIFPESVTIAGSVSIFFECLSLDLESIFILPRSTTSTLKSYFRLSSLTSFSARLPFIMIDQAALIEHAWQFHSSKGHSLPTEGTIKRSFKYLLKQERAFKINLARNMSQSVFLGATQQYQSIFIIALGARAVQLGFGTALAGIASIGAALLVGWLSSHFNLKKIFMLGVALMATGSFFFTTATEWWMVIPALATMTFALRVTSTLCPTICGSCFKSHERATGMALCDILSSLPRLIAPIGAAYLVTYFGGLNTQGIRPLYLIQFAGLCFTFMMIWRLFEEPHNIALAKVATKEKASFVRNVKQLFSEVKHVKKWIMYMTLGSIPIYLAQIYWTLFAEQVKGADQIVIGQMTTAMYVIPIAFSLPMGKLADVQGRKRAIYLTLPFALVSMLTLIYARNSTELVISAFLLGVLTLISAFQTAMTTEMVSPKLLGTWLSVLAIFDGLVGLVIFPAIAGLLWDTFAPVHVITMMIVTTVIAIPILIITPETLKKRSKSNAQGDKTASS
jgi:MFS family permease